MILVLLNWLFIFSFLSLTGLASFYVLNKIFRFPDLNINVDKAIFLGLIVLTTFCNIISFFYPINYKVNIGVGIIVVIACLPFRKLIGTTFQDWWYSIIKTNGWTKLAWLLLVSIALLKTVAPSEISDETGYHLPLIRWIEAYRIVPGIANIEDRMGFNPTIYMTNAFFSMRWLFWSGLYDVNGFLFIIFGSSFLRGIEFILKSNYTYIVTNIIQISALIFLYRAYLTSVDADFINIYGTIYLLLLIIYEIEKHQLYKFSFNLFFFFLFFSFLISNKFSIFLLAPLVIWVFFTSFRTTHIKSIMTIIICWLILMPWLARNYIISGYLIYPVYFLDWFSVDWKVPNELTKGQYFYVSEYAKYEVTRPFNAYEVREVPIKEWFFIWCNRVWKQLIGKIVILGLLVSLLYLFFLLVFKPIYWRKANSSHLLITLFLLLSTIIWFIKTPAIRFAWGWILVMMGIIFSVILRSYLLKYKNLLKIGLLILLFTSLIRSTIASFLEFPTFTEQLLYPSTVAAGKIYKRVNKNNIEITIAVDNYCGGLQPPCFPRHYHKDITPRGSQIEDGFKIVKK